MTLMPEDALKELLTALDLYFRYAGDEYAGQPSSMLLSAMNAAKRAVNQEPKTLDFYQRRKP